MGLQVIAASAVVISAPVSARTLIGAFVFSYFTSVYHFDIQSKKNIALYIALSYTRV
jgi:hypothetical protein